MADMARATHHPPCRVSARIFSGCGFTLVELLLVLAIGAILTLIAVPSMSGFLSSQKVSSLSAVFLSSLNLARSEAIKRNARAVLCRSANGLSCGGSGGWEQGWIVFHDANNNAQADPGETIVLQQAVLVSGPRLSGNAQVANYVSFSASGSAKLVSGAFQAGTFTLCPGSAASSDVRQIILSSTGRARSQSGSAADCP